MPAADPAQASLPAVRETVRELLLSSPAYGDLDPAKRRELAQALVKVCDIAAALLEEETRSTPSRPPARQVLAMAQNAGEQFSGVSASRVAGTTSAILNAVSFPRFVTELINGVFKALVDSNQQQMHSYVDLIKNVAATTEGFADANLGPDRARQWLVETFPGSFTLEGGPDEDSDPRDRAEESQESKVRLKEGASMPSEAALRTTFGLAQGESIPSGDPETALVPFARRALARQRQQLLATMVMLGMQRIVVESGRLNAAMRFHIDTRSAANSEQGSRFALQNESQASGKFGVGPWGLEAKMTNTIGYVTTQKNQSSEEMNTDLDLNSSVELYFKTDYVPLDRLAGVAQVDRIKVNTLNPDAEARAAAQAREARVAGARTAESSRSSEMDRGLMPAAPRSDAAPATATTPTPAQRNAAGGAARPPGQTATGTGGTGGAARPPAQTGTTPGGTGTSTAASPPRDRAVAPARP